MNPNYKLRVNEAVSVKKDKKTPPMKIVVMTIAGILLVGSFVFGDNLFMEMSWTARFLFCMLFFGTVLTGGKREDEPSPAEIWFFDDYLVIYREKRYNSTARKYRMEYTTIRYSGLNECEHDTKMKRLSFRGDMHFKIYEYDGNGVVSTTAKHDNFATGGIDCIRTLFAPDVDFASEIEAHSTIKVKVT